MLYITEENLSFEKSLTKISRLLVSHSVSPVVIADGEDKPVLLQPVQHGHHLRFPDVQFSKGTVSGDHYPPIFCSLS